MALVERARVGKDAQAFAGIVRRREHVDALELHGNDATGNGRHPRRTLARPHGTRSSVPYAATDSRIAVGDSLAAASAVGSVSCMLDTLSTPSDGLIVS